MSMLIILLDHVISCMNVFHSHWYCRIPPTSLLPDSHYGKMAECFGSKGYAVSTPQELRAALQETVYDHTVPLPVVINVVISPTSERRPQVGRIHTLYIVSLAENIQFSHKIFKGLNVHVLTIIAALANSFS